MSERKKSLLLLAVVSLAVLSACCYALFCWLNHPRQVFWVWGEKPTEEPSRTGPTLAEAEIFFEADGSGYVAYTVVNDTPEEQTWEEGPWVAYEYQGEMHNVTDGSWIPAVHTMAPGEAYSDEMYFPAGTFAKPGRYRFYVNDVGWKDIALLEDGTQVVGIAYEGASPVPKVRWFPW